MISKSRLMQSLLLVSVGLFVYMPFHIFLSTWLSTYTGGLDFWKIWKDIVTALVAILCVVTVLFMGKATKLYKNLLLLIGAYGLIHIILYFLTDQPLDTGVLGFAYNLRIFAYLIICYSLALLFIKIKLQSYFFKILIIVSTLVCFFAILQFLLPKDIMTNFGYSIERGVKPNFFIDDKTDLFRAFSTLRDPNSLGAFLILPITFLVAKFMKYYRDQKKTLIGGLLLLHVWVLLLTFSRSALLATFVSIFVLVMLKNAKFLKENKKKLLIGAVGVLLILSSLIYIFRDQYFVQNVVFHADESTTLDSPNELRASLAGKAIDGITEQPFGHGPGTAGLVSIRSESGLLTENYYLQILYEVGVVGFVFFVLILYIIVKELWRKKSDIDAKVMIASLSGLLFASLLFHTWSNEAIAISFMMLAGILLANPKKPKA